MTEYEVPSKQWAAFVERFGVDHRGEAVELDYATDHAENMPPKEEPIILEGLTLHAESGPDLLIDYRIEGEEDGTPQTFRVCGVRLIRLEQPAAETPGILRIEAETLDWLTLRFSNELIPGMLDGIAPHETGG